MHDLNRILLRPMDVFAVLCVNLFICALLAIVIGEELATYFYVSGILYLICYEVFHGLTHLYKGNNEFLVSIQDHHRIHHNKTLMGKFNFAVVFPFLDRIFNTYLESTTKRLGGNK
jgi:sterol desaturase/sphingolipid hydroxylase (fatty acid hydroxylase superfamily)